MLGIVENMSYYVCPECGHREEIFKHGGGRRTAEKLGRPVPRRDPARSEGRRSAATPVVPIVAAEPKSAVTEAYLRIAEEVLRQLGA